MSNEIQGHNAERRPMMQPDTWKAIADYSGKVWAAVGPLVGVVIGALLARAWERKKWERENRKEECRELLKSISHTAAVILNVGHGNSNRDADDAYLDSLKVFHDRIFIAGDIDKAKIEELWVRSVGDVRNGRITPGVFSDQLEQIRQVTIRLAINDKG